MSEFDQTDVAAFGESSGSKRTPAGIRATGTEQRTQHAQQRLAAVAARPRIKSSRLLAGYKPAETIIEYRDNKVGILPNLDQVLEEIAAEAGIDLSDEIMSARFLDALVTDVYINAYSDKQPFDGNISVAEGTFELPRRHIKTVIEKYVGTKHRRFARAMAPLVYEVMHDNPDYGPILDKRCTELNLSTRAEAVRHFDGADALVVQDRESARRNAEAKALALSRRSTHRAYGMADSVASAGYHTATETSI